MKIEISNKQLEKQLEEVAQSKYVTVELLISEILKEYVEDTSGFEIDVSVNGIRQEALKLSKDINTRLRMFENRFEVSASIVEDNDSFRRIEEVPNRYMIKVIL